LPPWSGKAGPATAIMDESPLTSIPEVDPHAVSTAMARTGSAPSLGSDRVRERWSWPLRIGFRFSFAYWMLYLLMNGNATIFTALPGIGGPIQTTLAQPGRMLAHWVGARLFFLNGVAANWHGGGSGDTALDYVRVFCFAVIALAVTALWCVLDRRRPDDRTLLAWLRFFLRLTLGVGMLVYGFAKVFPLQMRAPGFAILNNTYGNSSPMTLLWTLIGLNPRYEMVCGAAEVLAGLLILFRRTATLGALVTFVVVSNIVLYNFFFDVPVKLYASHLLLMCTYVLIPDMAAFWNFFVRHEPARLSGVWIPPVKRRRLKVAMIVIESVFVASLVISGTFNLSRTWGTHVKALAPTPITGAWQIDTVEPDNSVTRPVSPEGQPWTAIYIEDQRGGFYRSRDGALWRCGFTYKPMVGQLEIHAVGTNATFGYKTPDPDHLVLTRGGKAAATLKLHRVTAATSYPLLERGFHWVNEWGYER
jgi:hypothetical protein